MAHETSDVSGSSVSGRTARAAAQPARAPADLGAELGRRFVEALVRGDFEMMASLLHPDVRFRGLSPHKFMKNRRSDPVAGVLRAYRIWFYEGVDGSYTGDRPEELLACTVEPFGSGGRYRLAYRIRVRSREMAESFRADGLADVPDDIAWLVEQHAYYDVLDGKIAWLIVLCGGYQPLALIPTARGRPEADAVEIVV